MLKGQGERGWRCRKKTKNWWSERDQEQQEQKGEIFKEEGTPNIVIGYREVLQKIWDTVDFGFFAWNSRLNMAPYTFSLQQFESNFHSLSKSRAPSVLLSVWSEGTPV